MPPKTITSTALYAITVISILYSKLYNKPSNSRILIGSRL